MLRVVHFLRLATCSTGNQLKSSHSSSGITEYNLRFTQQKGSQVTKSELIEVVVAKQPHLQAKDVELAIRCIVDHLTDTLAKGDRIEIRGFGSFSLRQREARIARNPKTGESVAVTETYVTHFKPGNELRDRVDASKQRYKIVD